jgi:hypothetical protein
MSHTGHLHDVHGSVMLFPKFALGMICFTNFASSRLAPLINEHAFDLMTGVSSTGKIESALDAYEHKIRCVKELSVAGRRAASTTPTHPLDDYVGEYQHAA